MGYLERIKKGRVFVIIASVSLFLGLIIVIFTLITSLKLYLIIISVILFGIGIILLINGIKLINSPSRYYSGNDSSDDHYDTGYYICR